MDIIILQSSSPDTYALPRTGRDFVNMDSPVVHMASHALSTLTIMSCLFLKVPQIMHVREKQSAEGIYIQAMLMEIAGFTIVTLYNFTNKYGLMTYLEYPIILLQIYVLLYYVLWYKGLLGARAVPLCAGLYVAAVLAFASQALPKHLLGYVLPLCTPLSGFAKVTYMYGIVRARNADAVSIATWVISVSTNLARLFTVYVDSADATLMFNFVVSSLLSLGVLLTALYYQRGPRAPAPAPAPAPARKRRARSADREHDD